MSDGGEIAFQKQIRDAAKALGWREFRVPVARGGRGGRTSNGWPDLTLVRRGHILFYEIKAQNGRITPEQQTWLEDLGDVAAHTPNIVARVVRPSDYDEIIGELA